MPSTYTPTSPYYTQSKIQKAIKDLIKTAYADREKAEEHYSTIMKVYNADTENTTLLIEATKTLNNITKATEKIVKLLDLATKTINKTTGNDVASDNINIDDADLQSFLDGN